MLDKDPVVLCTRSSASVVSSASAIATIPLPWEKLTYNA